LNPPDPLGVSLLLGEPVPLPVGVVVRLPDTELVPVAVVETELVCEGLAPRDGVTLRLPVELCVAVTDAEGDGVPVAVLLPVLLPVSLLLGLLLPLGLGVDDRLAVELAVPAGGGTHACSRACKSQATG
jgi:hypothetical protein